MKKFILSLVLITSGMFASAQNKVDAPLGFIRLTPDVVFIQSTGEYVYLARNVKGEPFLYISKKAELSSRFSSKGNDSIIVLEGTVFKPLQHYTKKQWRKISKEVKIFFPSRSQEELENMDMFLVMNYGVFHKDDPILTELRGEKKSENSQNSPSRNNGRPSPPK